MRYVLALTMQEWTSYLVPLAIFVIAILAGFIVRAILFNRLNNWAKKSSTQLDDIVISSIKGPSIIWFCMLSIYLAVHFSTLPVEQIAVIGKIILALGILSASFALANLLSRLIGTFSKKANMGVPTASLTQNVVRIIVLIVGSLVILHSLGISITPILATLGVGGLAVALALQDTLANLFAGFYIIVSKQVKVGDYIKIESGEEGYVIDINWRTTQVKMLPNNVVLIPNDKLLKAIIVNYYLPDKEMAVILGVGVHYGSDLEKVERITSEVAKEVMKEVAGGIPEFEPFIRYHSFSDSSINFNVIMRAKEFTDQHLIKHEFIKRLHKRYGREGIVIPYPIRAINYDQEKAK